LKKEDKDSRAMKTVVIKEDLYRNLERLSYDSGFEDVNNFVNFILKEAIKSAYGGRETELMDDKEKEKHLLELLKNNPEVKEYYVALFNYYLSNGDHKNAGDMKVKILNRFH
jgi:hypothetical protein|tara:strand:- start:212 stop:547 length:336 start_codon:yes stop_codon:yes gene_type:complete